MSSIENMLSDFLASEENMEMVAKMASSMGIELPREDKEPPKIQEDTSSILQLFSNFEKHDDTSALLRALKPFLRRDMAQKVESAVTAARIAQAAGGMLYKKSPEEAGGR